ncbi:MAG: condensation domain-containing protein, partial [Pseudomonadota bacterium]
MSSIPSLLEQLSALDIHISLVDGQLHLDAPKGALTPELKRRLHAEHQELTAYLHTHSSVSVNMHPEKPSQLLHPNQLSLLTNQHTRPNHEAACVSLHLDSHIDATRLLNAWTHVLERHGLFNASWRDTNSGIQRNTRSGTKPKPYFYTKKFSDVDVIHTNYGDINAYVYNLHIQDCQASFDLTQSHFIRLNLNQIGPEQHLISISAHPHICDDLSLPAFMTDVMDQYHQTDALNKPETSKHASQLAPTPDSLPELTLRLTQQQQHIQRLDAEQSNTYRFNHKIRFQLTSVQHLTALHSAFEQLCRRHPILGASLDALQKQLVCTSMPLFTIENLCYDDTPVKTCFNRHADVRVALSDQTLSNIKAYQVNDDTVFICMTVHAMICDSDSLHTIANDFKAFYTSNDSQSLITQFKEADYLALNHERYPNTLSTYKEDINYWKVQLADAPSRITFANSAARTSNNSAHSFARQQFQLNDKESESIRQFLHNKKIDAYAFFLANYHLLLSRHSGQNIVSVVIPASNAKTDTTPAYQSSNALVIKLTPGHNPRAERYFNDAESALTHAQQHNRVAFFEILKHTNLINRDELAFHSAGFDFQSHKHSPLNNTVNESTQNVQLLSRLENKTLLYFQVTETDSQYVVDVEYDVSVFNEHDIQLMSGHYIQLMNNIIDDTQQPVNTLSLNTDDQLRSLLNCSPAQYSAILPLTNMQRDIYIDTTVNAQQTWNYFGQTNIFNCELNPQRLQDAINSVIAREPALHSHIKPSHTHYSDIAYRCVLSKPPQLTLATTTHDGDHTSLKTLANEFIHTPYKLENELPLRTQLVRFNNTHWAWMVAFHHIVVDGLGMHMFIQTVLSTYEALSNGDAIEPLNYPFSDYAEFNRLQCDTQETIDYWSEAVKKATPLSGGRHLATQTAENGEAIHRVHTFSKEHSADIRKYCFSQRSTPAAYIKSILTIALNGYFKQEQQGLIFNEVRVGRTRQTLWTIGCCFTNQPFIVENELLTGDATFKALLHYTSQYAQTVEPYSFISNSEQKKLVTSNEIQATFN